MYPPPGLPFPQQPFSQQQYQQSTAPQPVTQFPYQQNPFQFHEPPAPLHQKPTSGMLPQHQQSRPANNYRPRYNNNQSCSYASTNSNTSRLAGGASARQLEVDNLVDGLSSVDFKSMEASFTDLSASAIIDLGASNGGLLRYTTLQCR
jgi:hypothetical protein